MGGASPAESVPRTQRPCNTPQRLGRTRNITPLCLAGANRVSSSLDLDRVRRRGRRIPRPTEVQDDDRPGGGTGPAWGGDPRSSVPESFPGGGSARGGSGGPAGPGPGGPRPGPHHLRITSLLVGLAPADVHVPLPLDADLFLTHRAADPLGALDDPLADCHLLLDHRPLLHGDLLLPDRDADLLARPDVRRGGLTRRGMPLDDDLLALHRDLDRPVLGDDLLADPDRARLHGLLMGLQLLLVELDPLGALGRPQGMGGGAQVVGPVPAQEGRRLVIAALRGDGHGGAVGFGPADGSGLLDRDLVLPEPGLAQFPDGGIRLLAVLKGTDDGRTLLAGRSHGSSPDARSSIPSPGAHPAPGLPSTRSGGGAKPMPECSPESRNNGIHWINAIYTRTLGTLIESTRESPRPSTRLG